jgi:hypothetical protein
MTAKQKATQKKFAAMIDKARKIYKKGGSWKDAIKKASKK